MGSLHATAFALGMAIAGLCGARLSVRLGSRGALVLAACGMAVGAALLVLGRSPLLTIGGAFVMGALGTLILVIVPALLAALQGRWRAVALTEANVIASFSGGAAPLAVGGLARAALGWRGAFLLGICALVPLLAVLRTLRLPPVAPPTAPEGSRRRLPAGYWRYWAVLVCSVSLEFCMIFWTADFLHTAAGASRADAAACTGVFLGAMLLGRAAGSRLARLAPPKRLLGPALGVAGVGFLLYWLVPVLPARIAGLFITGLGIANLYPMVLSLAIGAAASLRELASARATLASASAIGVAPLVLGGLADHVGIDRAYAVMPLLVVATFALSRLAMSPARAIQGDDYARALQDGGCTLKEASRSWNDA